MKKILIFCTIFLASGLPVFANEQANTLEPTTKIEVRKDVLI